MRIFTTPCPALAALLLAAACTPPAGGDDDDAVDDDDTTDDAAECGDPSGGSGGPAGSAWLEVEGYGDPGDEDAAYEVFVHAPDGLTEAAPVFVAMARRMPHGHAEIEEILLDFLGLGGTASEQGWIVAMPLPGPSGAQGTLHWSDSQTDRDYFRAALGALGEQYDIDRDRVFLWGSSAGASSAILLGHRHADLVAGIIPHAGRNPFQGSWPPTPWDDEVPALFIHDEDDPIVPRSAVMDAVEMWQDAGQVTETHFAYDRGHEWVPAVGDPPMADFVGRICNGAPR